MSIKPIRILQALSAVALAIGIGGMAWNADVGAQEHDAATSTNQNTYDLSAQADALDVLVTDPNLPVSSLLTIEAGPYGASAALNSLGQSAADAGAPYSPAVASLPGTISGLGSGFLPPLPPLPGYVSANYPGTPTDQQTQGGYQIAATSSPSDAKGSVTIGVQPAGSSNATMFASAETAANSDGSVNVNAASGLDALSFGQLFDLANVSSSVSLSQAANGNPIVKSQTNLGTVTLLGQATGLSTSGLSVLGLHVPVDVNAEVIGTLNTLLAPSGVSLTYLPETIVYTDGSMSTGSKINTAKTLQSIDSGALRITVTKALASQGTLTVTMTVGRVFVTTTDTPGFGALGSTGNTGNTGNTGAGLGSGSGVTSPSFLSGNTGAGAGSTLPVTPSTTGSSLAPTVPRALADQPTYLLDRGPSGESLYDMLILVALAVLLGSQAVRVFSVRLAMSANRGD